MGPRTRALPLPASPAFTTLGDNPHPRQAGGEEGCQPDERFLSRLTKSGVLGGEPGSGGSGGGDTRSCGADSDAASPRPP